MEQLPTEVIDAWNHRDPIAVLTTVDAYGTPNTIYISCYGLDLPNQILICDSAFAKTRANILGPNSQANFLFFAPDFAAFQLKGTIDYHTKGPAFDAGLHFQNPEHPVHGIARLTVEAIYKGSTSLHKSPHCGQQP